MFIDIIYIGLLLLAFTKGVRKGLIQALFNTVGFLIGIAAAVKLSAVIATHLSTSTHINGKWLPFLSFVLIFSAVVLAVKMIGKLFEKTSELVMLGWVNKLGGICLYVVLYSIIFSVILFYIKQLGLVKKETIDSSVFYPYLAPIAPDVIGAIGKIIPFFKNIFSQLEDYFGAVSNKL